jgi:phosphoglycerate dehydrogenase-like enzyme
VVPLASADGLLSRAHHVVNLLPANDETVNFFDGRRFALLRPGAVFYNVGRGWTVDQEALRAVLEARHLRAAYLDVTDPEPLPPEHPLWSTRGCVITPHSAGGHDNEHERLVAHFLHNLERYRSGWSLLDRIF